MGYIYKPVSESRIFGTVNTSSSPLSWAFTGFGSGQGVPSVSAERPPNPFLPDNKTSVKVESPHPNFSAATKRLMMAEMHAIIHEEDPPKTKERPEFHVASIKQEILSPVPDQHHPSMSTMAEELTVDDDELYDVFDAETRQRRRKKRRLD